MPKVSKVPKVGKPVSSNQLPVISNQKTTGNGQLTTDCWLPATSTTNRNTSSWKLQEGVR
jgi:hypothetical protein